MTVQPLPSARDEDETKVGNYFISNYPPFSFWNDQGLAAVERVTRAPMDMGDPSVPLGLYVHLPFCRKRCDFCYFKVYTDKNSADIRRYLDGVLAELDAWVQRPYLAGRGPRFVYFGGGTPSYLSADQLEELFAGLRARIPWDDVEEVAFEAEPGTLSEPKVEALRDLGVTRLSFGVENFDPRILEVNNRAHRAKEIYRVYEYARSIGFPQINVDLIAGMVGETDENWAYCVEETVRLAPESVTIYQMEVPHNTTLSQRMKDAGLPVAPVADWETKRRWVAEAFARLEEAGYHVGSAYTAAASKRVRFLYRDALWHGADMLGLGVSSFSHLGGVHFQNQPSFEAYLAGVEADGLGLWRGYALGDEERLIREFVLQLKLGRVPVGYFRQKFGVDVRERFAEPLAQHARRGLLAIEGDEVVASREGLLRIDSLLESFFLEPHRNARYT